jgi:superfamily I DNA and/or RNA helicase
MYLYFRPGTGKTVTCVEAILQLFHHKPATRILACAPSNSAADLIASRLVSAGLRADGLFRMCAPSRSLSQLPNELLPYVYTHANHFSVPGLTKLRSYRIIVSTCVSASMLFGVGVPPGHYTHVFVDEAGQATEPEVMVPIATMAGDLTNVVLSGDPKQLGPIIRSSVARVLGLEKSYLERIMERKGYNEDTGPHESYVHLPSLLFCYADFLAFSEWSNSSKTFVHIPPSSPSPRKNSTNPSLSHVATLQLPTPSLVPLILPTKTSLLYFMQLQGRTRGRRHLRVSSILMR